MLRRDPTPIALTDSDVQDVRKAAAEWFHAHNGPPKSDSPDADGPVNALEQAKKKKEGKSTAQRIGLSQ
ncbi:hypothetical protein FRC09_007795 [Ceratobasidium sp. 395]|nr:hypothetical protein FRC09_007795 [Ceratobasidium sp. 395]